MNQRMRPVAAVEAGAWASAVEIAEAVRDGTLRAADVAEAALARIAALDGRINAFTDVIGARARAEAAAVDAARAAGRPPGPLAGVPYAVKNLFDVVGLPTRAGSLINRGRAPATRDALLVRRMRTAGAVLIGTLNMGEYAYDFTGENAHDGSCRNPHDPERMSGGSSSGCGAATAAGLAPISLGSDTNGSLRVPASLCGVFSLKPTYGRLPRTGAFPFVDGLDHLGPMARSVADLAAAYDALQGPAPTDHGCAQRPVEPIAPRLGAGAAGLRIGVPGGWFCDNAGPEAMRALALAMAVLAEMGAHLVPTRLDGAAAGRAAAFLITNAEGAAFHLGRLRARAADFDPETRDRFLAGAFLPAAWVMRAQRVRHWWLKRVLAAFADLDLLLVPATPVPAPLAGSKTLNLDGRSVALRPVLGLLAQPFSCVGVPVATVPVFEPGNLPIGLQLVAPPWREDRCLQVAAALAGARVAVAHPPGAALSEAPSGRGSGSSPPR